MEIQERLFARTRPLMVLRSVRLMWLMVFVTLTICAWATWAHLEEQIRAPGKVIVSSRSQIIQAVDGGVLRKLHVREGDTVRAGDLLAELDTARFQASTDEIGAKVLSLQANIRRLQAELDGKELSYNEPVWKDFKDLITSQRNLHDRRLQLQREELDAIGKSLDLAQRELTLLERLAETGDAAQTEVLKMQRQVNELRGTRENKRNAYRQEAQSELAKSRGELEQAEQVLNQRKEALQSTKLHAPMSGTVKNVRITTLGAVLKSGDELMQIVPSDDPLIIEARVRSSDVAFVRNDLRANVKLDAYDYTVYGSLKGHVTYISPDTLEEELKRDEQPYYRVLIQIDEIPEDRAKDIDIIPGMTCLVEIITGERSVAQYILKPLRRVSGEALTER